MQSKTQYLNLYRECRNLIASHSSEVMNALRDEAYVHLEQSGFPTKRVEDYKYTDVETLFAPDYGVNINRLDIPVNPYDVFKCDVPNMSTSLYFVVNDTFYNRALPKATLPEGVILGSLKELSAQYPELVARYYGQLARTEDDAITALNTMLAQDGLFLYVPKGVVVEKPIQLVNILRADVNFMVNRRVLIVVEDNAQVRILACDHTTDEVDFLATQVVEAFVGCGASLELYELEESTPRTTRLSNLYVQQESDSRVHINDITLVGGVTRNTTRVALSGRGAHIDLCGMAIADKQQHVDNHTFIDHAVSDCTSHELYKYVLDDEATGAFAGKVIPIRKSNVNGVCVCIYIMLVVWSQSYLLLLFSIQLFVTPWTVALQAPLYKGFSRQEYRSGFPFPSPGHLRNPIQEKIF